MKTIHLLGSEGFIGRAIQREAADLDLHCWSHRLPDTNHHFDLLEVSTWDALLRQSPTHLILLCWPGLPNYQEVFHLTRNLPACIGLIEKLMERGLQRLVIAGTCYEYGLQNGRLKEDQLTDPVNCYAIAKDSLRRVTANLCDQKDVSWCWARIFYPYGQGQNPHSFLPSLQRAIENKSPEFAMSSGRQIRDFISVDEVARQLLLLATNSMSCGIYNCGSGQPISLRELAEKKLTELASSTTLKLGAYPDRSDEPLAFWADTDKINQLRSRYA